MSEDLPPDSQGKIIVFGARQIRRAWHDNQWYFSMVDIIAALTDCVNTESAFRIIQSIPSPKAEPFKRWLAKVGYQRMQEIENPELAQQRMRQLYKEKGYPDNSIENRVRGIAVRDELTAEWQQRGVKEQGEFAILTGEISKEGRHAWEFPRGQAQAIPAGASRRRGGGMSKLRFDEIGDLRCAAQYIGCRTPRFDDHRSWRSGV